MRTAIDRHDARRTLKYRGARLRRHRRQIITRGVGPGGRSRRPSAIATGRACGSRCPDIERRWWWWWWRRRRRGRRWARRRRIGTCPHHPIATTASAAGSQVNGGSGNDCTGNGQRERTLAATVHGKVPGVVREDGCAQSCALQIDRPELPSRGEARGCATVKPGWRATWPGTLAYGRTANRAKHGTA